MKPRIALAVTMAALALLLPAAAPAATIAVNTQQDIVSSGDGMCSLREALLAATSLAPSGGGAGECPAGADGHDVITLGAGTFGVGSDVFARSDMTIAGAGAAETVIDQVGSGRVLRILGSAADSDPDVTLEGLTITGGQAPSGADGPDISANDGTGAANGGSAQGGNGGPGQSGGGILNDAPGVLTLLRAVVTGNRAGNGGQGGLGEGGHGGNAVADGLCGNGGFGDGGDGGDGGHGGGIYSEGPLVVLDSTISGNHAGAGGWGGVGVAGNGGTAGTGSQFGCDGGNSFGGKGGFGGQGGAVLAIGAVTVTRSLITGNRAGPGGLGGDGNGGSGGQGGSPAWPGGDANLAFGGAGGFGGSGGGVSHISTAPLVIIDSRFDGNEAGDGGAAGDGHGGIGGQGATSGTGWFGANGTGASAGGGGAGGAIYAFSDAAATIRGSLLTGNTSGDGGLGGDGFGGRGGHAGPSGSGANLGGAGTGGKGGSGGDGPGMFVVNALVGDNTLVANSAGGGGAGGAGTGGNGGDAPSGTAGHGGPGDGGDGGAAGGGAVSTLGAATVVHGTVAENTAGGAGAGGAGIGGSPGSGASGSPGGGDASGGGAGATAAGGIERAGGTLTLTNSIVAANMPANCSGAIDDGGGSLRFGDETCPGTTADPLLQPLGDNGGPTQTLALGAGSPARGAGAAGCTPTDQRGVARVAPCDAGAYEAAAPAVITGDATAVSGTAATLNGTVTPWFGAPSYRFEYGTTDAYGSSTEALGLGGGLGATAVSAAIGGLAPGTTYHYRLVAENVDGSAAGNDRTFTTSGGPGPGGGGGDIVAPAFDSASLKPKRFRVDRKGARETPVAAARKGTTFSFALSEAARVVFAIQRARPGRKVGKRCVKPTAKNRKRKRCTRWKLVGRFAVDAAQGANTKRFSGRIGSKRLRPGRHRAVLVATDAAGNASARKRLRFRVVRR